MSAILLVHPDFKTREAMSSILEKGGHRVFPAQDGPEALELFKRNGADLVVLNRELPGLSCTQAYTEIQRIAPQSKVLVLDVRGIHEEADSPEKFGIRAFRPGEVLQIVEDIQDGAERASSGSEPFASRILVVDDDRGVLDTLRRFLTEKGYEVGVASDGLAALPLLKRLRPHLVLLDIDMPKMNGIETLRRIREIDGRVGVMMITGNDTIEAMERCQEYGAYDYLLKPFNLPYLAFSAHSKIVLMTLL
ncbi:MAG TPA: response regulator [Elusimicrobiota bacterium]|jgi:DNA-binding response OmpR family regulator|nr:response regulator [Elusimicrobiota bacterium]